MSRPTSDSVLLGHGTGATPPPAAPADAGHAWLDATLSLTLLAPPGAAFDDEDAVRAWARRAWLDLASPGDGADAPEAVAWRCGRGAGTAVGVTWSLLPAEAPPWRSVAPLWAGVLAHLAGQPQALGPLRLVVAEGRALTLIDTTDGVPQRWSTLALQRDDAAALDAALAGAPGPVWVAGHSLPGPLPSGVQALPGLGLPSQPPSALLQALAPCHDAEPALRRAPPLAPRLALGLLATATVVLALAGSAAWSSREAWQAAQHRAEARERLAAAATRERRGGRAADAAAQQRLQQPWALRWAVAEAAAPAGGAWLRLEQRREPAPLLLVGEAETPSEALAVARRIGAVPGVAEARMLRSESATAAARARFELGVRLGEPAR